LNKEEVDRLFEKQATTEKANRESNEKNAEEWCRQAWLMKKCSREYPNDNVAKAKRWREERRSEVAGARLEAREIQDHLDDRFQRKYVEVLKQGVLEGAIQIHETDYGFMIDTPDDKVNEYVENHPTFRKARPAPDDLKEGKFLLGTVSDWEKEEVNLVRNSLIDEFQAETPSDFMLIDLAVSNYVRSMYATQTAMDSIRYADHYRMESYEVVMEGLQPYIQTCQNQLLRILRALHARKQPYPHSTFTHETYSRTDINLENWGQPLLLALADVTEHKEQDINIDEIKQAMVKHVEDSSIETIPNAWIGYALGRLGFAKKIHSREGNHYNIERTRVLTLLNEDLKA
jgi:hypothetical protein